MLISPQDSKQDLLAHFVSYPIQANHDEITASDFLYLLNRARNFFRCRVKFMLARIAPKQHLVNTLNAFTHITEHKHPLTAAVLWKTLRLLP